MDTSFPTLVSLHEVILKSDSYGKDLLSLTFQNEFVLFQTPPPSCTYILDSNVVFQKDCILPSRCGYQHYHKISSTWYGGDVGLCIGIGAQLPFKSTYTEVDMYGYHLPSNDWYAVHRINALEIDHTFIVNGRKCHADTTPNTVGYPIHSIIVLVNKANNTYMLPKVYKNYMTTFRTDTDLISPITDILEEVNGKYCLPRITPSTIQYPKTKHWNTTFDMFPIFKMYNPPCIPTDNSQLQTAVWSTERCYDPHGTITQCNLISQSITCNPLAQTTSYSIPGSKLIVSIFEHIIQFIIDFIFKILNYLFEELATILITLNLDYKLLEMFVLMLVAIYYAPSTWTPLLVLVAQSLTIGLKRT